MKTSSEKNSGDIWIYPNYAWKMIELPLIPYKFRRIGENFHIRKSKFVVFKKEVKSITAKIHNCLERAYFTCKIDLLQLLYPIFEPGRLKLRVHLFSRT